VTAIERFNRQIKQRERLSSNVLEIVYSEGVPQSIKTSSYVGVIKVGRRTIQILPKVLRYVDSTDEHPEDHPLRSVIQNLLYMLSFTKRLSIKEVDVSMLRKVNDDFFEVLIYLFATHLMDVITRNVNKDYFPREENVTFLKGKIKFKEQLINNAVFKHRFFTQFDEFSENNLLNQVLKYTTHLLLNVSTDFGNLKLLQEIAFLLSDITFKRISVDDLKHVHLTRLNREYEPILNLCKLFISQSSVELSVDKISTFSFIFDMNALFEEFISEFIKREFYAYYDAITLQGPRYYFVEHKIVNNEEQGHAFQMRPDIVLKTKGPNAQTLIIDTKYKLLEKKDKKEGVSQPDLYQMHAYSTKYACSNAVMLYPQFDSSPKSFDFHIDKASTVYVRTVNLCRDLKRDKAKLRNELEEVLHVVNECETTANA
jgi:5-methylcytosine-specific restriction enzyme subunit McrC